jgi:hypothetical protein
LCEAQFTAATRGVHTLSKARPRTVGGRLSRLPPSPDAEAASLAGIPDSDTSGLVAARIATPAVPDARRPVPAPEARIRPSGLATLVTASAWPRSGAPIGRCMLASVAGEVAVVPVDHGQAGAHVAGEVERAVADYDQLNAALARRTTNERLETHNVDVAQRRIDALETWRRSSPSVAVMPVTADGRCSGTERIGFWLLPDYADASYAGRSAEIDFTRAATAPEAVNQGRLRRAPRPPTDV